MAQKPDGKAAKTDKVTFTRPAAERIAKVVRRFEQGDRGAEPLYFDRAGAGAGNSFALKVGTFTGNWQAGTYKVVTLDGSTQTASVYNFCNSSIGGSTSNTTQTRYVIFGKAGGTNAVVEIQAGATQATECTATLTLGSINFSQLPGFDASVIQMLGHGAQNTASTCSGGLQWFSIATCSTATAA